MAKVVPTILATTPQEYSQMLERALSLQQHVHVDITDGRFTDNQTIGIAQINIPEGIELDLHLMVEHPEEIIETALSLHPRLIILHAESQGDLASLLKHIREMGVQAGVALLPQTAVESATELIKQSDHVLIFTGTLGHNGGQFQINQLGKVDAIRAVKAQVEISVDGGVSDRDAALISLKGVDVLYTGSFLQTAEDPEAALGSINRQIGVEV
jgi:ribulose-phosphate 3-epimerase